MISYQIIPKEKHLRYYCYFLIVIFFPTVTKIDLGHVQSCTWSLILKGSGRSDTKILSFVIERDGSITLFHELWLIENKQFAWFKLYRWSLGMGGGPPPTPKEKKKKIKTWSKITINSWLVKWWYSRKMNMYWDFCKLEIKELWSTLWLKRFPRMDIFPTDLLSKVLGGDQARW